MEDKTITITDHCIKLYLLTASLCRMRWYCESVTLAMRISASIRVKINHNSNVLKGFISERQLPNIAALANMAAFLNMATQASINYLCIYNHMPISMVGITIIYSIARV